MSTVFPIKSGTFSLGTDTTAALAGSEGTPSAVNPFATVTDPRISGLGGVIGVAMTAFFGTGRDGSASFNGNAVTGFTLASNVYTRSTKLDVHYYTVTVATGYSIDMAGFRMFAYQLTCGDNCVIGNWGSAGSGVTAGVGAPPRLVWTTSNGATFYGGTSGGAGRTTTGIGTDGSAIGGGGYRVGGTGGNSGRCRLTSGASITNAGSAQAGTDASSKWYYWGDPYQTMLSAHPMVRLGADVGQIAGGTGGAGGSLGLAAGTGTAGAGSGGGGAFAGGFATASFGTGCSFNVSGAAGIASVVQAGLASVSGGGGGGGGGAMTVIFGTITGSNLPTFTANGGAGGAAALDTTGGLAAWAEGGNGGSGGFCQVHIGTNETGGTPTVTAAGGAAGTNVYVLGAGYTGSTAGATGYATYWIGS